MRSFYYFVVLLLVCFFAEDAFAQTRIRRNAESNNNTGLPELSVRASAKNEAQGVNIDNVVWLRVLYRNIDLKKEANAPLYFPTESIGDRMNLFTLMFKLIIEGKLAVYEYLDGREVFTDQYKIDPEKWLNDNHFVYQKTGTVITVDEIDIPSSEVLAYMVKEVYYFDQATGTFGSEIIAICPMRVWEGDYGETQRTPLCWIPYENVRPYISRSLIMTSNYNNALTYTTDDFFQLKMYEGEIIKTVNMMNYTLAQQFPDSTAMKYAQDSIEKQIKGFETRLWLPKDTVQTVTRQTDKRASSRTSARAARSNNNNNSDNTKAAKAATPKSSNAPATPTRSVRRR